jgi:hypothetical protein
MVHAGVANPCQSQIEGSQLREPSEGGKVSVCHLRTVEIDSYYRLTWSCSIALNTPPEAVDERDDSRVI